MCTLVGIGTYSMEPIYSFPVLRGIQAGREYYLAMCPLKLVPKIFLYDEEGQVPPELRAQRTLNSARIPDIVAYIVENPRDYVFSAITASIDAKAEFEPLEEHSDDHNIGWLRVPMDARIIINDGQHRQSAIKKALKECPELGAETIPVVFFIDAGLRRSQQMFADLNKHAVRPSKSLGILYEHRDPLAVLARRLMMEVPVFKDLTEKEKTSISNRSPKLFTLSSIFQATQALLAEYVDEINDEKTQLLAIEYWTRLSEIIPEWYLASRKEVSCAALREQYVHAHGVALEALGKLGAVLIAAHSSDWPKRLESLRDLDWSRSNTDLWEGRAMLQGRISKANRQVRLTVNLLKETLGLPLTEDEELLENEFMLEKEEVFA